MSFWTAIVIIVGIMAIAEIVKSRHRSHRGTSQGALGHEQEGHRPDPEAQREIEDLRERIKVLERIATEGNSLDARDTRRISAEIEALRDKQAD